MPQYSDIDSYIACFPEATQKILNKIRDTIKKDAPESKEKISYGIPTFTLNGNLIHFAAYKNHIGFYPGAAGIEAFKKELSAYEGGKGSVRFPLDRPIPFDLINEIVKFRVIQNSEKVKNKKKKG
jgi:uncharacterized protein YdhG (YjbR/CyaY superfamily)